MPTKNPAAVALGSLGGKKTMKLHGKKHFSTMGKNSAIARAKKRLSTDKFVTSAS